MNQSRVLFSETDPENLKGASLLSAHASTVILICEGSTPSVSPSRRLASGIVRGASAIPWFATSECSLRGHIWFHSRLQMMCREVRIARSHAGSRVPHQNLHILKFTPSITSLLAKARRTLRQLPSSIPALSTAVSKSSDDMPTEKTGSSAGKGFRPSLDR